MTGHRARLPLAIVVAVVAAGAATVILRPRGGLVEPTAVSETAYFSPGELERAHDFRDVQRLLGLGGLVLTGAALTLIALRPPRRLVGGLERRPVVGGAAAGAGLALTLVVVGLPLDYVAHERARDVGLATQSLGPWLGDVAKSAGVGAVVAALGGAVGVALLRRFRARFWIPAAAVVVAFGVLSLYVYPLLVDPLFNKFEPLRGPLRAQVLELADRAGVDVGEVYRVDASRRTTGANAYVNGIGHTKRVVLYDNLIEDFPRGQVRSVVAHELGHVKHRDILRGLAWLAIVAPAGTFLALSLARRIGGDEAVMERPGPSAIPALALALAVVAFGLGTASNAMSRKVEQAADSFALRLTDDPRALIDLQRRLAIRNVSDPQPPELLHDLFGTHPTTMQRIGAGVAFERR